MYKNFELFFFLVVLTGETSFFRHRHCCWWSKSLHKCWT